MKKRIFVALLSVLALCFMFADSPKKERKSVVVYFSRPGENYSVGTIKEGNTQIVAELFARITKSDLVEIVPVTPYPVSYSETAAVVRAERKNKIKPEFTISIESFDQYETIYLGYPIWYGDVPNIVKNFLESYDFSDKVIIPFCTHEGSGHCDTHEVIKSICKSSTVEVPFECYGKITQVSKGKIEADIHKYLGALKKKYKLLEQ